MRNLAEDGIKLVEAAAGPPAATEKPVEPKPAPQAQLPGYTWENVPKTRWFKLQGARDLPALDKDAKPVNLAPRMMVYGTFVGQVDGANIRGKDGEFNFTDLVTVLEAKIEKVERISE